MCEWPPSFFILNLWVLVQSDLRGDFSHSNFADLALDVASLVVRFRNRRRAYLIGRIPGGGCAAKCARIRFCCMGEVFALLGDATLNTRISKPTAYKTTPRHLYLWACPPSSSSLFSLNLVRLVNSSATHHGMCSSAFSWARLYLRCYLVESPVIFG